MPSTLIDAWYRPAASTCAAVVLVHGKYACRSDVLRASGDTLVEAFVGAGVAVLMIDLRGHGASGNDRITYSHQKRQDVLGAVD
jgi:alpha-beta hydrolase superfamily lysophospholipase